MKSKAFIVVAKMRWKGLLLAASTDAAITGASSVWRKFIISAQKMHALTHTYMYTFNNKMWKMQTHNNKCASGSQLHSTLINYAKI